MIEKLNKISPHTFTNENLILTIDIYRKRSFCNCPILKPSSIFTEWGGYNDKSEVWIKDNFRDKKSFHEIPHLS